MMMTSTRFKNIFYGIITIGLLFGGFQQGTSLYAQHEGGCFSCNALSPELEMYRNFVNESLTILNTPSHTKARGSNYNVYGPWAGGGIYNAMFQNKDPSNLIQSIVLGTLQNIQRRKSQIGATANVLGIYTAGILENSIIGLAVTTQSRPIMRDYQYLNDLDTIISDTLYTIGISGQYGNALSSEERKAFAKIVDTYTGPNKLFQTKPTINAGITANNIIHTLLVINTLNKQTLAISTSHFPLAKRTIQTTNTEFIVSENYISKLSESYACTRGSSRNNACQDSTLTKFSTTISSMADNFLENGPQQARQKITTATQRLITRGKLIGGTNKDNIGEKEYNDYKNREHDLISSWGDGQTLTKKSGWALLTDTVGGNLPMTIRKLNSDWKTLKNDATKLGSNIVKGITGIIIPTESSEYTQLSKTQKQALSGIPSIAQYELAGRLEKSATSYTIQSQKALSISTDDGQKLIATILIKIRATNNIITNNISKDLTVACQLQCTNLPSDCG